jgi:PAS domain S-box-containing protein
MSGRRDQQEIDELRRRLEEAEETLRAIRDGSVDAFVVEAQDGHRVFTLEGADRPYRLLVERMPVAAATLQADGTIVYGNGRLAGLLGVPHEKLIGSVLGEFVTPPARPRYETLLQQGCAGAGEGEVSLQQPDGTTVPVMIGVSVLPADCGAAVAALITDLTAQKHHEQLAAALQGLRANEAEKEQMLASERAARAAAERTGRVKDEFLATLSHELRTPLNAILGWAQVLRQLGPVPEPLVNGLAAIDRNARMQAQLIADLLDMNRIVSGKMRLDVQRVELPVVIHAALDSMRPAAEAKGVRIQTLLEPMPEPIHGDPARLQQVIWNLLSNAVKFTPKGGRVQVVLARVGSNVEISVSDTGQGLDPSFLPHVFERFTQADASAAREHGGLGIGLSIVKQLVELHGGTVHAVSEGIGKGATFSVRLPVAVMNMTLLESRAQHPKALLLASVQHDPPDLTGVRVLVVDDERDARELVRHVLQDCGAEVLTAGSATEATVLLQRENALGNRLDVILSDIGMPTQDGYAWMRSLRGSGVHVPAAALTAFARSEDRTRALTAGYQAHIAKPMEPAELLATVAALANRTSAGSGDA